MITYLVFILFLCSEVAKKTNAALNSVSVIHCLALLYLTTLQQRAGLFFLEASYCLKDEVGDSRERELIPESHFQAVGRCMIDYFFLYLDRTQTTKCRISIFNYLPLQL